MCEGEEGTQSGQVARSRGSGWGGWVEKPSKAMDSAQERWRSEQAGQSGWSQVTEGSSRSEREGLGDGSETCCDEWFGESGTDRKRHIEISSKILVKINIKKIADFSYEWCLKRLNKRKSAGKQAKKKKVYWMVITAREKNTENNKCHNGFLVNRTSKDAKSW